MSARARRARHAPPDYWPGFVDALSTLLLVIIFLLSIFMLGQFYLNQALTGRDQRLAQLSSEIATLANELSLKEAANAELGAEVKRLTATLQASQAAEGAAQLHALELESALAAAQATSSQATDEATLLGDQLAALRLQFASLQEALDAAEAKDKEQEAQIVNLGARLNAALAQKVGELAEYRSEFFGKLKAALGNRTDIEIVGDRFVLQSEIFFDSASATVSPAGQVELKKLAGLIVDIAKEIPSDLPWIIRVDGHSDRQPISTPEFPSNWHLSAARAVAVVRYLESQGVPSKRLAAAGFGEFHPLDPAHTQEAYTRNRRIELKLTER
ncbi:MAG: peptidoglycan -binding protein [Alphaproteobacteria bacterium]|nr:peptidoglycan -binding protein [Alphaproteobacteria bacterium]